MRSFFLPDYLVPPPLAQFWHRYLALGILSVGLFALRFHYESWLRVDPPVVHAFGLTLSGLNLNWAMNRNVDSLSYQDFCNFAYLVVVTGMNIVYLAIGISIYGWKRLAAGIRGRGFRNVGIGILAGTTIWVLGDFLSVCLGLYSGDPSVWAMHHATLFAVFTFVLIGPATEEFACRLVLYQVLRTRLNFLPAAAGSSLVFGLLHFGYPDPMKIALVALGSIILCWFYERSGSILTVWGIHAANNLCDFWIPN